jgi:hypothetical protein
MPKLVIAVASATLLIASSGLWKADAATINNVGTLTPLTKSYTPAQEVAYYHRYGRRYARRAYRRGYGYGYPAYGYAYPAYPYYGYAYRPYAYGYGWRPGITIGIGRPWGWGWGY